MKRWHGVLTALTLAAALGGMLLSLTVDSAAQSRATLAQVFIFIALAGFIATVLLRSARDRAVALATHGAVEEAVRQTCGFSSVAQFCTKYREIMGVSPKQMQKKMLINQQTIDEDKYSN